jgi:hypothetical protein
MDFKRHLYLHYIAIHGMVPIHAILRTILPFCRGVGVSLTPTPLAR